MQDVRSVLADDETAQLGEDRESTEPSEPPWLAVHRFEASARLYPELPAVVCGSQELTYRELDACATSLARHLRALGVGPEIVVGVCLPRRIEVVVAVLAVFKARGAYLPLDPSHPVGRRRLMLADAGASVLITTPELAVDPTLSFLPTVTAIPPAETSGMSEEIASEDARPFGPLGQPGDLAYVMYTSGSTGRPKGVMIEQGSVAALLDWALTAFSPAELSSVLASTSLGFDLSVFELLAPIASGGCVVMADSLMALSNLAGTNVSLVNTVPSVMEALLRKARLPPSVHTVCLAGEPLSAELVERVYREPGVRRVLNAYGPTEDTVYSTVSEVIPDGSRPSIGTPIPGTRAFVLDEEQRPAAVNVAGELYLGGAGLARGYRGRPDLTRERFVPNPLPDGVDDRLYRTGDLARWESDGSLTHLGRIDDQIKLRGVRIEPAEIEGALLGCPSVEQAAVATNPGDGAGSQLVAYVVCAPGQHVDPKALRDFLGQRLPPPMIPSVFKQIDEMPLTGNGKLDRKQLGAHRVVPASDQPLTRTESRLGSIWARLLELPGLPGPDDDFFALGGHSLLAVVLFHELNETFGRDLPTSVLLQGTTLRELAANIDRGVAGGQRVARLGDPGARLACIYVHTGAGGMLTLRSFGAALGAGQQLVGIQAFPDRRGSERPLLSIRETADECLAMVREARPRGPYVLAGHSAGGHVAFEMACRLRASGEQIAFLGLIDPPAPHTLRWHGRVVARARDLLGMGPYARGPQLAVELLQRTKVRLNRGARVATQNGAKGSSRDQEWRLVLDEERSYRPGRFPGGLTVYCTMESARFSGRRTLGWDRYVSGPVEVVEVPGDHLSVLVPPHVETLANDIRGRLDALG